MTWVESIKTLSSNTTSESYHNSVEQLTSLIKDMLPHKIEDKSKREDESKRSAFLNLILININIKFMLTNTNPSEKLKFGLEALHRCYLLKKTQPKWNPTYKSRESETNQACETKQAHHISYIPIKDLIEESNNDADLSYELIKYQTLRYLVSQDDIPKLNGIFKIPNMPWLDDISRIDKMDDIINDHLEKQKSRTYISDPFVLISVINDNYPGSKLESCYESGRFRLYLHLSRSNKNNVETAEAESRHQYFDRIEIQPILRYKNTLKKTLARYKKDISVGVFRPVAFSKDLHRDLDQNGTQFQGMAFYHRHYNRENADDLRYADYNEIVDEHGNEIDTPIFCEFEKEDLSDRLQFRIRMLEEYHSNHNPEISSDIENLMRKKFPAVYALI